MSTQAGPEANLNATGSVAAEILEASVTGYAAAAAARLDAAHSAATWQTHFRQRILELAAAVRVGEPALFLRRVVWLRRAALARKQADAMVRQSLQSLRSALDEELPADIRDEVLYVVDSALAELDRPLLADPDRLDPSAAESRLALDYVGACLDGKLDVAAGMIGDAVESGMSLEHAYSKVLLAAQKEVGRLWHADEISVADERLVSETTRRVMARLVDLHAPSTPSGPTVLAACVTGDAHDLGLRAAADLFVVSGWRCLYLGADVPTADLAASCAKHDADLALLNATLSTQLASVSSAIAEIRRLSPRTRVLVGGTAFDGFADISSRLGADAYAASIEEAVRLGEALVLGAHHTRA